jgi:hypothetical protein
VKRYLDVIKQSLNMHVTNWCLIGYYIFLNERKYYSFCVSISFPTLYHVNAPYACQASRGYRFAIPDRAHVISIISFRFFSIICQCHRNRSPSIKYNKKCTEFSIVKTTRTEICCVVNGSHPYQVHLSLVAMKKLVLRFPWGKCIGIGHKFDKFSVFIFISLPECGLRFPALQSCCVAKVSSTIRHRVPQMTRARIAYRYSSQCVFAFFFSFSRSSSRVS